MAMILQVDEIQCGYGEIEVLRGVSFSVQPQEIVCLIGPNGAGKSTLLKTIFGLVTLWNGRILFQGEDISRRQPDQILRKGISLVPQGRCNFPEMTVRENLEMGAYIRRDKGLQKDINDVMARFPVLEAKQREFAGNLSGGEQQIMEMASALLLNPKIVLLDEPSLGLSPLMVAQVFETITKDQFGRPHPHYGGTECEAGATDRPSCRRSRTRQKETGRHRPGDPKK